MASTEIVRRLDECDLDMGLTFLDERVLAGFQVHPLYREQYVRVARDGAMFGGRVPAAVRADAEHAAPVDRRHGLPPGRRANCPLHPETEHMINADSLRHFKRGAYLIDTARGKLCDRDAIVAALHSGQLAGYAGDVWFPQPAPSDHPWRTMPHHGMTPHISGTSLSAQARYAAGTREILECHFEGRAIRDEYLAVHGGAPAGVGAHSYSKGNATQGAEEAERYEAKLA